MTKPKTGRRTYVRAGKNGALHEVHTDKLEDDLLLFRRTWRFTSRDLAMLEQLRIALHLDSDGQTVRALIRMNSSARQSAEKELGQVTSRYYSSLDSRGKPRRARP